MPRECALPEREVGRAKKTGRALAWPEFREETPRRRTAEPPEAIHAAPHKIRIAGRKSTPDKISLAALAKPHSSNSPAGTFLCGAANNRLSASFRTKVIRSDDFAAASRSAQRPVSRSRRHLAGDRTPPGAGQGA